MAYQLILRVRYMIAARTDPTLTAEERQTNEILRSRIVIDACRPYARLNDFPRVVGISAEYRKTMMNKWRRSIEPE